MFDIHFVYPITVNGMEVGEIEGTATIDDYRAEDWFISEIWFEAPRSLRREIMPVEHPLFDPIKQHVETAYRFAIEDALAEQGRGYHGDRIEHGTLNRIGQGV